MKNMLISTLISAGVGAVMGGLSNLAQGGVGKQTFTGGQYGEGTTKIRPSFWQRMGGARTIEAQNIIRNTTSSIGSPPVGQRGGFVGAARSYGLFQGGGSVPVAAAAPALGGGNTNNININLDLSGGSGNAGDGRSQSQSGNSGAPASASTSESDARALSEKIKAQVVKVIAEEQRVGGSLSPGARRG